MFIGEPGGSNRSRVSNTDTIVRLSIEAGGASIGGNTVCTVSSWNNTISLNYTTNQNSKHWVTLSFVETKV